MKPPGKTTLFRMQLAVRLREIDRDLAIWLRGNDVARRLMIGLSPFPV
jgi:hypothetical protein